MEFVTRFLQARVWVGIAGLVAILALVANFLSGFGGPDQPAPPEPESIENDPENSVSTEPQPPDYLPPIKFSVHKRVRCPGGGDWLGRERNKRSATIEFRAPAGRWIEGAEIIVIAKHYGSHRGIKYDEQTVDGALRKTRAHAQISCNPPNYPGAPGGWMEVRLKSKD